MATVRPDLNSIVAHMKPVKAEVKKELRERAALVQAVVDEHTRTGHLAEGTKVVVGRTDSTVYIEDEAVFAINYGHVIKNGKWVEGIHAIEAAL